MASIAAPASSYVAPPPTNGKVTLRTTVGDIEIELWSKEAPLACRNFCQLALEGYYDGTIFHRVIPRFMAQAGDPTGTGSGGQSIYGKAFKDEFHKDLVFQHRGIVACANENKPNTNGSQFFLTLDAAPHLNRRHTIFGKVVGQSIFALAKIGECATDGADRPLDPPSIVAAVVDDCPFDDIIPRALPKRLSRRAEQDPPEQTAQDERPTAASMARKARTKTAVVPMSFGDEDEDEDEEAVVAGTGGASLRGRLATGGIRSAVVPPSGATSSRDSPPTLPGKHEEHEDEASSSLSFAQRMAQRMRGLQQGAGLGESNPAPRPTMAEPRSAHREREHPASSSPPSVPSSSSSLPQPARRRKRSRRAREDEVLSRLAKFKSALQSSAGEGGAQDDTNKAEPYHGQVLESGDDAPADVAGGLDWAKGSLRFKRHTDDSFRGDVGDDGLVTIDDRLRSKRHPPRRRR